MSTRVALTDEELAVLDGRASDEVQVQVDAAKARLAARDEHPDLPPHLAGLVADVVTEATSNGELRFRTERLRYCPLCETHAGYVEFKSGPRKGQNNWNRPRTIPGIEFAYRFVSVQGHVTVGGCRECVDEAMPVIREALRGVRAQVPKALRTEGGPRYVKHDNRRCTKCGWTGHEGQMTRQRTLMGDGTYPAGCPDCGAENLPLGRDVVERIDGFEVVEVRSQERAPTPSDSRLTAR
jgi:hypothetical protein